MARRRVESGQDDLFSIDPSDQAMHVLDGNEWPAAQRVPVNRAGANVREHVWADLVGSERPTAVAGYAAIGSLVELIASWFEPGGTDREMRVLLGAEPFPTTRRSFGSASIAFTDDVRRYWAERGISLRLSAKIVTALEAIDAGAVRTRFVHGSTAMHAKVYVGSNAATVGSSNFTAAGLVHQIEANVRFERSAEPQRYDEVALVADNLWLLGQPWDLELRELLVALLRVVPWQETLAAACVDLLEGQWAARYLASAGDVSSALWPTQRAGIAQALWIIDSLGSVLVADATGSGKTKMGAHLVRAVRDRMWATGRARGDVAVVVCPPAVESTWQREAQTARVNVTTVSHGLLSREESTHVRRDAVADAQILAVDESHNFLNRGSNRSRQLHESRADHVLLFTATPINRGASDLLQLVSLLGADNFDDPTLEVLQRLERRRGQNEVLTAGELDALRREVQGFTVRRTKRTLNELVDREPHRYVDPLTGRTCRYPDHHPLTYATGESPADEQVAEVVRRLCAQLVGVSQLERAIVVPAALRHEYTDERWLSFRLSSVRGLAAHHVLGAMRSSRAAVAEHLRGSAEACARFGVLSSKTTPTGDVIGKLRELADAGPPEVRLTCDVPGWLTDPEEWRAVCAAELGRYVGMDDAVRELSDARETAKAALLVELASRHERVLAFDRHPITLEQLRSLIATLDGGVGNAEVVVATGATTTARRRVEQLFARNSTQRAIALCSDAMNEGLNLQGASAVVHLDLPTTLRVAEQRIGRVDRMDSPHDAIEAWWPRDGRSFATRANELLAQRASESAQLLGANLPLPDLGADQTDVQLVDVEERIAEAEAPGAEAWDGIRDALEPVRLLVSGSAPLVPSSMYDRVREHAVAGRHLSPVVSDTPWAFLAIAGGASGAPRWLLLEGERLQPSVSLDQISDRLRHLLAGDPTTCPLDDAAVLAFLDRALDAATHAERALLPRRHQRALAQLSGRCDDWSKAAARAGDEAAHREWRAIGELARRSAEQSGPDPLLVAETWIDLVAPRLDDFRRRHRHRPFVLLRDIDEGLRADPLAIDVVRRAMADLPVQAPLGERVTACIIGVVGAVAEEVATPTAPRGRHAGSR
jgi:hypothetical protein